MKPVYNKKGLYQQKDYSGFTMHQTILMECSLLLMMWKRKEINEAHYNIIIIVFLTLVIVTTGKKYLNAKII